MPVVMKRHLLWVEGDRESYLCNDLHEAKITAMRKLGVGYGGWHFKDDDHHNHTVIFAIQRSDGRVVCIQEITLEQEAKHARVGASC